MSPQWHVKDPGHSAKSAGGRLHPNTHIPLTQRRQTGLTIPLCRHSVGNLLGNELTRNSSGKTRPWSSQLAEPLWTDLGLGSAMSVCDLISTIYIYIYIKKRRQGTNYRAFSQSPRTDVKYSLSHQPKQTVTVASPNRRDTESLSHYQHSYSDFVVYG